MPLPWIQGKGKRKGNGCLEIIGKNKWGAGSAAFDYIYLYWFIPTLGFSLSLRFAFLQRESPMNQASGNGKEEASIPDNVQTEHSLAGAQAKKREPRFRLTERDYALFKFLLDQKFGSLEALFFKFFDPRKDPNTPPPKNLAVARQRLGILKRAGLITTEKVYSESKSLYLLSKQGWKVLRDRYPDLVYAPPALSVDFRNYEHDARVTLIRIALEKSKKATKWYPERRIRMQGFRAKGVDGKLPETVVPDGIFLTPKLERVAVELEVSVRKKSRFKYKMSEYEAVLSRHNPLIHKVLFVAASDAVGKDLSEIIGSRANFFLETYPHFHWHLYGNTQGGSVREEASEADFTKDSITNATAEEDE